MKKSDNRYIKFCPHCQADLYKNKDHAQGVLTCKECGGNFYIICTTKPDSENLSVK